MRHHRKTIAFLVFFLATIAAFADVSTAPTARAQTSGGQSIAFFPLNSDGSGIGSGSSASWQTGASGYVLVGSLPSFSSSSNPLIDIYLADPSSHATTTRILEIVPLTSATNTYAIDPNLVGTTTAGTYSLVLVYSVGNPPQQYVSTSPVSLVVSSPQANPSANPPPNASGACPFGYVYNSVLDYCQLQETDAPICQSGSAYDPATGSCAASTVAPTVTLGSNPSSGAGATAASNPTASPAAPSNSAALPSLVVCGGAPDPNNPGAYNGQICNFSYFLQEMRTIINWLFVISIPIAVVLFAYGGVLYITGTAGNRTKANGIFTAAGIGFAIMLVAWAAVYTIVGWLTSSGADVTTFLTGK